MLLVLLAVLPALGVLFATATEQRRLDAEQAQAEAHRAAALVAYDLEHHIGDIQQVLLLLTQMPEVRADPATCQAFLRDLAVGSAMYGDFNVSVPSGAVRCASATAAPANLSDRDYFQRALATRELAAGDFSAARPTDRTTTGPPSSSRSRRSTPLARSSSSSRWGSTSSGSIIIWPRASGRPIPC